MDQYKTPLLEDPLMGMSQGRSFSHQRLMPLPGCSMHKPSATQTSQFFIKEGILSPLVNKSDDSHRGKRMLPLLSKQDMFKLEYNFEEVRKVPFRKTYNREKLVLLNTNSSILTQKESLTRLGGLDRHQSVFLIPPKNRSKNKCQTHLESPHSCSG